MESPIAARRVVLVHVCGITGDAVREASDREIETERPTVIHLPAGMRYSRRRNLETTKYQFIIYSAQRIFIIFSTT